MEKTENDIIKDALAEIERACGRSLRPEDVVNAARDKKHPLHSRFDWDDNAAAHKWRLQQARQIINSVRIVTHTDSRVIVTPYYVRDPSAKPDEQGYLSVETLRTDKDVAREAIVNEFSMAASYLRRARDLAAVLGIEKEVDEVSGKVEGLKTLAAQVAA